MLAGLIREALSAHESGQLPRALVLYRKILKQAPQLGEVWNLAGNAAMQIGDGVRALEFLEQATALQPDNAIYHHACGEAFRLAGRPAEAAKAFQRAASLDPLQSATQIALGNLEWVSGGYETAQAFFETALRIDPNSLEASLGLGNLLLECDRPADAIPRLRKCLEISPDCVAAAAALGHAGMLTADFSCAIQGYRTATELEPGRAAHWQHLGEAQLASNESEETVRSLQVCLKLDPAQPGIYLTLAAAYVNLSALKQAEAVCRTALAVVPEDTALLNALGGILYSQQRVKEALECFTTVVQLTPDEPKAIAQLARHKVIVRHLDEADGLYQRLLALCPEDGCLRAEYAASLALAGRIREAREHFDVAVQLAPDNIAVRMIRLFVMHYDAAVTTPELVSEHKSFGGWFDERHPYDVAAYANSPEPGRRLRIGYLSADFKCHAVISFVAPLLGGRDSSQFEAYCYSNGKVFDDTSRSLRPWAEEWRLVAHLSDLELAEQIRADGIDILVDLSGFSEGGRPRLMAMHPAPVQILYLGYFSTTGMAGYDYYISDAFATPPALDWQYTESVIRLPGAAWCYCPMENAPPVADLPALSNGAFTFGCLNNPAKLNDDVFRLWARILKAVPSSRLRLHLHTDAGYRERVMIRAAELGLDPARVDWQGRDTGSGYLRSYSHIDLALDPFPYGGGATTCDAFWMGVPTVTLADDRFMSRISGSLLQQANLGQFVASSPEEYVSIAVEWASRVEELAHLRQDMRTTLKAAPLLDQHGFMQGLEAEYRRIWTEWCQRPQPGCDEPSMAVAEI